MKKGFTLLELLVVISIIGFLSSVILASVKSAIEKSRITKARNDAVQIVKAIIYAQAETGRPLISFAPDTNCMHCACTSPGWNSATCLNKLNTALLQIENATGGVYKGLSNIKSDPWGNAYFFDANQGETGVLSCSNLDGFTNASGKTIPNWPAIPLATNCP